MALPATITLTHGNGEPIVGALVCMCTDKEGTAMVAPWSATNEDGQVDFFLESGETYYLFAEHSDKNIILPKGQEFTAQPNVNEMIYNSAEERERMEYYAGMASIIEEEKFGACQSEAL